jgi:hypothetical protein
MATMSRTLMGSVALFGAVALSTLANAQTDRYEALANSPMAENRPTPDTGRLLKDELLFQRAAQTYLWALRLINTLGMRVARLIVTSRGLVDDLLCDVVDDDGRLEILELGLSSEGGTDSFLKLRAMPSLGGFNVLP